MEEETDRERGSEREAERERQIERWRERQTEKKREADREVEGRRGRWGLRSGTRNFRILRVGGVDDREKTSMVERTIEKRPAWWSGR